MYYLLDIANLNNVKHFSSSKHSAPLMGNVTVCHSACDWMISVMIFFRMTYDTKANFINGRSVSLYVPAH